MNLRWLLLGQGQMLLQGSRHGAAPSAVEWRQLEAALVTMPEGAGKEKFVTDKERLDLRISILTSRKEQYGKEALIIKQLEYNRMDNDTPLYDTAIAAVEARKLELAA